LAWAGRILEARLDRRFAPGEWVSWLIPGDSVLLHQRRRPSRGERENPVYGRVVELLTLGGLTTVLIRLQDPARLTLTLELPPHVARRNYLKIGEEVAVSLVAEAIHLMPWQPHHRS
ncbi:MAG: TOBE domain-containing protein, partial [Candidatus Competibacteraceae bacterium]|nr:TOBE domain-containing protein [Candidatus Competibacteraceae bacterium]